MDEAPTKPRILVAVASYGTSNDRYLERIIQEYRSMPFAIDIVVVSNIDKKLVPGVECLVGIPTKNPWSLPFAHRKLFTDRCDHYDLFIYSEDDILITERNLRAWLELNQCLQRTKLRAFCGWSTEAMGCGTIPMFMVTFTGTLVAHTAGRIYDGAFHQRARRLLHSYPRAAPQGLEFRWLRCRPAPRQI